MRRDKPTTMPGSNLEARMEDVGAASNKGGVGVSPLAQGDSQRWLPGQSSKASMPAALEGDCHFSESKMGLDGSLGGCF